MTEQEARNLAQAGLDEDFGLNAYVADYDGDGRCLVLDATQHLVVAEAPTWPLANQRLIDALAARAAEGLLRPGKWELRTTPAQPGAIRVP